MNLRKEISEKMSNKNYSVIAKPASQKKIALPSTEKDPADEKKIKPGKYRYFPGEEPEASSIFSYARGRMGTVYD
jgi:hypothetical protein